MKLSTEFGISSLRIISESEAESWEGGKGKSLVSQPANGKKRLKLEAEPGPLYTVEASTDLLQWQQIGVMTNNGSDVFEFEDATPGSGDMRFYRVVSP